ncbi:MAG: heavy metal-responsive transcriptional regulator [Spirochaetia bacterium]|jgi:DNA-binding transcriptional MerR regulator
MGDAITKAPLRSGQLAALAGVSSDTLRHYERKGLLASRRAANGYREYQPEALARVRLIQHSLSVGFALDELARFLTVRDKGGAPCKEVRALASRKLEDLEERIDALQKLRDDLRAMLKDWDARLAGTHNGGRAWLLETLVDSGPSADTRGRRLPHEARNGGKK